MTGLELQVSSCDRLPRIFDVFVHLGSWLPLLLNGLFHVRQRG